MTLFTLDQPEGVYDERAYTRIDLNRAIVGNRWIERSWSGFFGNTHSVIQKAGDTEWVTGQNPEFMVTMDGKDEGINELGEILISDHASELGASVSVVKSRPGLELSYTTTALHEIPVLLRSFSIRNIGTDSLTVDRVCTESLQWEPEPCDFFGEHFRVELTDTWSSSGANPALAVQQKNRGLIFGALDEALVQFSRADVPESQVHATGSVSLEPLQTWEAPKSYLMAFEGDPYDAYALHHNALLTEIKLQERREAKVQQLLADEDNDIIHES